MADYIKREDAEKALLDQCYCTGYDGLTKIDIQYVMEKIPSADVQPVVHGKWEIKDIIRYDLSYSGSAYEPVYRCSNCGFLTESYVRLDEPIMPEDADFPKYCGNCGARMNMDGET